MIGAGLTVFGYVLRGRVRRQVLLDGTAVATGPAPMGDGAWALYEIRRLLGFATE